MSGARDLFELAREDAPSSGARDAIWSRVAAATTPVASGAAAAPAAASKLLVLGGLIGTAVTALGVALALGLAGEGGGEGAKPPRPRLADVRRAEPGARLADAPPRGRAAPAREARRAAAATAAPVASEAPPPPAAIPDAASELAEEARLVTDARAALMRAEPARALQLVQRTRKLSARALEPEELGLEARALHALGRDDEALATELVLRRRFPDHALAR